MVKLLHLQLEKSLFCWIHYGQVILSRCEAEVEDPGAEHSQAGDEVDQ